jgi:ferredoxin like protein
VEVEIMTTEFAVRIEDKLFQNRYLVDQGRAHIKVRPHTVPSPALLALLKACPARCYELNNKGQVEIAVDGCIECGTCRIIAEPTGDITWSYPRGGYGVLFKFG